MKALTRIQKRLIVAKDALEQLEAGRYYANRAMYFEHRAFNSSIENAQQAFRRDAVCRVCAKGALFLSHVLKLNEVKTRDIFNAISLNRVILKSLTEFGAELLSEFEFLFEELMVPVNFEEAEINKLYQIFNRYYYGLSTKARLAKLLRRFIKMKGKKLYL